VQPEAVPAQPGEQRRGGTEAHVQEQVHLRPQQQQPRRGTSRSGGSAPQIFDIVTVFIYELVITTCLYNCCDIQLPQPCGRPAHAT
jgi:hypothetical protein